MTSIPLQFGCLLKANLSFQPIKHLESVFHENIGNEFVQEQIADLLQKKGHISERSDLKTVVSEDQTLLYFLWGKTKQAYEQIYDKAMKDVPVPDGKTISETVGKKWALWINSESPSGTIPIGRQDFESEFYYLAKQGSAKKAALTEAFRTARDNQEFNNLNLYFSLNEDGKSASIKVKDDTLMLLPKNKKKTVKS